VNQIYENEESKQQFLQDVSEQSNEDCSNFSKEDILDKIQNSHLKNKPLTILLISSKCFNPQNISK
jgi:hypothetical protein